MLKVTTKRSPTRVSETNSTRVDVQCRIKREATCISIISCYEGMWYEVDHRRNELFAALIFARPGLLAKLCVQVFNRTLH